MAGQSECDPVMEFFEYQEALRPTREKYRRLLEIANLLPEAIFEMDEDGTLTFVNKKAFELFRYTPEDFLGGLNAFDMLAPEDCDVAKENAKRIMAGQQLGLTQYTALRKDGSRFPCLMQSVPVVRRGRFKGLRGFLIDITVLKERETALQLSEAKYRQLLKYAPAGICEVDIQNLKLLNVNEVICDFLGYSREELLSMNMLELFSEDSLRFLLERQKRILARKKVRDTVEYKMQLKDGREIWIMANARYFYEEDQAVRALFVLHEITQRKLLEEQLLQSQKMEAIGRLAGGVAHDFNNMLTSLQGHAYFLSEALGRGHYLQEHVEEIAHLGRSAAALVRQLLAFSRKQILQTGVLSLNQIVRKLEKMLARVIGEHIELQLVLAEDLGQIEADPGQIEQVLLNLVVNAKDALPDGGTITIESRNIDLFKSNTRLGFEVKPGPYVGLSVSDTGAGISKEDLSKIFEPFYTTKRAGKGTGLGLSTVYGIVRQSSGYIGVDSEAEKGTTFTIYFPKVNSKVLAEQPSQGTVFSKERAFGENAVFAEGMKVLVVEDDTRVRRTIRKTLEPLRFRLLEAGNAEEALDLIADLDEPLDLMVTDLVMPGMNGLELTSTARQRFPDLKALVISGYSPKPPEDFSGLEPHAAFLEKPFLPEDLVNECVRLLNLGSPKGKRAG
jgi:two-component system cell cycle sensor histidine kinase/response regulator CckA